MWTFPSLMAAKCNNKHVYIGDHILTVDPASGTIIRKLYMPWWDMLPLFIPLYTHHLAPITFI